MPTLAAIVNDRPAAARVLERFQLDYCCGGDRELEEACAESGVDPAEVLTAIEATGTADAPAWVSLTPAALCDHIEATHHRYLRAELPRLTALTKKVVSVHGERHPELRQLLSAFDELRADLEPHLRTEELVAFPAIRSGAQGATLDQPLEVLLGEHERVGDLLAVIRALTSGYRVPEDGCASYRALYESLAELEADTHLHVHKENNVLFPAVAR